MIGYLDKNIRPLVLIIPKMSGYVNTFVVKEGDNKLMSFRVDDEELLEKNKAIRTKIEGLKNLKSNVLSFYDDTNIKTKISTFGDKV